MRRAPRAVSSGKEPPRSGAGEMSVEELEIVELDISTQEATGASISKIKSAIESVSKTRSDMGALQKEDKDRKKA